MATNTYEALRTTNVTSAVPSVTLDVTGITGYKDLIIACSLRADANTYNNQNFPALRFNGDSTSGLYSTTNLYERNGSLASSRSGSSNEINLGGIVTTASSSGMYSPYIVHIQNYKNTSIHKTVLARLSGLSNLSSNDGLNASIGLWKNTNAINTISLTATSGGNFVVGSTFTVYGIADDGEIVTTAKATGGTITYGVDYTFHTFTSGGTFTPTQNLTNVDYLVVAGGGGAACGGGGAGGLRSTIIPTGGGGTAESKISLTSGTAYTITVGAGGSGGSPVSATQDATQGVASSITGSGLTTISSVGGGRGTGYAGSGNVGNVGGDGGSGGGALCVGAVGDSFAGGNPTTNQGFAGGTSTVNGSGTGTYWGGGGGGGAGSAGMNGISYKGSIGTTTGGNGGLGLSLPDFLTGGVLTFYAGGGAGGAETNSNNGIGGAGGGGTGRNNAQSQTAGVANTGGGGGGTGPGQGNGQAGGSGIVIIRYAN